jgi:hypothetical protein
MPSYWLVTVFGDTRPLLMKWEKGENWSWGRRHHCWYRFGEDPELAGPKDYQGRSHTENDMRYWYLPGPSKPAIARRKDGLYYAWEDPIKGWWEFEPGSRFFQDPRIKPITEAEAILFMVSL